jgi:integrase
MQWSDLQGRRFTSITYSNLEGIWHRLLTSAGVPKVWIHDLRHLNVSLRRKLGQDAKLIADQIGHTDPAFTVRLYTHLLKMIGRKFKQFAAFKHSKSCRIKFW